MVTCVVRNPRLGAAVLVETLWLDKPHQRSNDCSTTNLEKQLEPWLIEGVEKRDEEDVSYPSRPSVL